MSETEGRATEEPTEAAEGLACPVAFCPVGMLLTVTGQARPEVLEHLLNAGRELALAARAVLDSRVQQAPQPARLEKIEVD